MTSRDFIDLYIFLRYYGFEDKSPFKEELALAQEAAELRSIVGFSEVTRLCAQLPLEAVKILMDVLRVTPVPLESVRRREVRE